MSGFGRTTMASGPRVLDALQKADLVRVPELAGALSVSEITIRRDLDDLAAQARRWRGSTAGPDFWRDPRWRRASFAAISTAGRSRSLLAPPLSSHPGDTVMLSGGTTTLALFREIASMDVRIVTNNAMIIGEMNQRSQVELFVLGGEYNRGTRALNGDLTNLTLNEIHGAMCFLGTNAISQKTALTSSIYPPRSSTG